MSEVAGILKRARALISDPADWSRTHYAWGVRIGGRGPVVRIERCAMGAIMAAAKGWWLDAARVFSDATGIKNIVLWGSDDNTTHADVLAAFDRAVAFAAPAPPQTGEDR